MDCFWEYSRRTVGSIFDLELGVKRLLHLLREALQYVNGTAIPVGLDVLGILHLWDFLWLCGTWLICGGITRLLVWVDRLFYGSTAPVWMTDQRVKPRGIILLVPGYTNVRWQATRFAHRLHHLGFVVVTTCLPENGNTMDPSFTVDLNRHVLEKIHDIGEELGLPVTFFGISYGGLCAAYMAKALQENHGRLIDHLVLLQAPVRGTRLAKFGELPAAKRMHQDSDDVAETIACIEQLEDAGVAIKTFCAIADEVVRKRDSRLPRTQGRVRWSDSLLHIGHWGALQNPFALATLCGYISNMTTMLHNPASQKDQTPTVDK